MERVNRILKTMIVAYIEKDQRTWDENLTEFRFAYNTAHHTSLDATPAFQNLGREPKPLNSLRKREEDLTEVELTNHGSWDNRMKRLSVVRDWVIDNLDKAFVQQSKRYNLRRRELRYHLGDLVLSLNR